jgi:hypothetical protein
MLARRKVHGTVRHEFVRHVDGAHHLEEVSPNLGAWPVRQHYATGNIVACRKNSAPSKRNSAGKCTAWLEPFLNSFAIRNYLESHVYLHLHLFHIHANLYRQ